MNTKIFNLPKGMRLVTERMEGVETVSLGVWVNMGTRFENVAKNGVSHLLEHMAFKGTEKRNARQIAEEIEDVGGWLNAYTSRETTAYYAKVLKEDTALAADIIADIMLNSSFPEDELIKEKEVVVQEIMQNIDTPDDLVFDYFQKLAYPDHTLGMSILGTAETVRAISRDDLFDVMSNNYTGQRMVFSAAGKIDENEIADLITSAFSKVKEGEKEKTEKPDYQGGVFFEKRPIEQVNLVIGFDGISCMEDDYYGASVFSTAFGGGMSSRLFQEIREKRGLVYSVFSSLSAHNDSGLFTIYAGTGTKELSELLSVVKEEIGRTFDGFDEAELNRAKAQIKASILMSLESTSSRCEQIARQVMIFDRVLSTQEVVDKINAVDNETLKRVAKRIFASKPSVAMIGPSGNKHIEKFSL